MKIIDKKKDEQRKIFRKKRNSLSINNFAASQILEKNIVDFKIFEKCKIIASFISTQSEISTTFLNDFILNNNKTLCLPVIDQNLNRLIFREYDAETKLIPGKFGIMEPIKSNKELMPQIILTPCLAFDSMGFRLGYGGGYYDKTFLYLKNRKHKFISIAVAFDEQKASEVVHDIFDQKINYILTEKKLYKI